MRTAQLNQDLFDLLMVQSPPVAVPGPGQGDEQGQGLGQRWNEEDEHDDGQRSGR